MTLLTILDAVPDPRIYLAFEEWASKLQRTAAPAFDFEVKTYVGGKYSLANLDALLAGQAYDPENQTTLTAAIAPDDTTIPVASTTGFDKNTFVIEPATDTEQHELVAYTSKDATNFYGCSRGELLLEETGYHTSGDKVYEWYPITDYVSGVNLSYDMKDGVAVWSATVRGWNWNSRLLDNDNSLITMIRWRPKDNDLSTWTTWEIWFIGYITQANLIDRHTQAKEWTATVGPISEYVNASDAPALHFGRENLAHDKTVTVSSFLEDPYLGITTGEYVGYPNLDGPNAVDEDIATLWMSQGLPLTVDPGHDASRWSINEIYLRPPPGFLQSEYQWIEIAFKGSGRNRLGDCDLVGGWPGGGTEFAGADKYPVNNFINLGSFANLKMDDKGSFCILCRNVARFKEMFGGAGAAFILDWRQGVRGEFRLDPDAGYLALHDAAHTGLGWINSIVWWRSGAKPWSYFDFQGDADNEGEQHSGWNGYMLPSDLVNLPLGTSFTRRPDGRDPIPQEADGLENWYYPNHDPTPGQRQRTWYEFISVDLGEMNIVLDTELSAGETTEAFMDASLGLNDDGVVQINAEIMRYQQLDSVENKLLTLERGLMGTTPAIHPVDSIVKQWGAGTAYNLYKIDGLTLLRRRNLDTDGNPIVPKHFDVFMTDYADPVMPDDHLWDNGYFNGGWQAYWTKVYTTATNESPVVMINLSRGRRCRHVCVIIYEMSDAGRACVNEYKIFPQSAWVTSGIGTGGLEELLDGGQWSGDIIRYILVEHFGLPTERFIMTDLGRPVDDLPTTKGAAGATIKDICQRTGCMIIYHLDNQIEHLFDPTFPLASVGNIQITWDRTYARNVRVDRPFRHNVSQVRLWASNPFVDEHFEARYPPQPLELGAEMTIEDTILSDLEDAHHMAQMHFARENGPMTLTIEPVGPAEWVRPGQRHGIDWLLDEDGIYMQGQNFIVTAAEWQADFGTKDEAPTWRTSIRLQELRF